MNSVRQTEQAGVSRRSPAMVIGQVKIRERALLFRSLQVLFQAGLSLPRSLRILRDQVQNKQLKYALEKIEERILSGVSFSFAVKEFPYLFSDHCRRTIEVAEAAGALPQVMSRLSEYEEKSYQTSLLFKQALIYPIWILVICVIFVLWVPPFLFGELFSLVESSGVELPLISRVVLRLSKMVASPFFYLGAVVVGFFVIRTIIKMVESPASQYKLFLFLHSNSFLRRQLTALATCRFSRCLELMTEVGVPITQALKLAGNAAGDPILKRRMPGAIQAMINGSRLDEALAETDFFPATFISSVSLGQEAGSLSDVLSKIVVLYETELEYRARGILAAMEPLAMLFMGITVAIFIIATMLPLMELIKNL